MTGDDTPIAESSAALRAMLARIDGHLRASAEALDAARKLTVNAHAMAVETAIATLPETTASPSEHRRLNRPGRPAKIDSDSELKAFITARIEAMTFDQIEAAAAAHFPPERRVRKSAIHTWWRSTRNHGARRLSD